ncbi:MAG: molybdopterin cofactor-binding domain-containing protein, partial [Gemmatimonadota bacterium]
LAMLVAEELDVPWNRVRVEQMGAEEEMGPRPYAGGSWTVRAYWLPFRRTGAAARQALVGAAAARWDVDPSTLGTEEGEVLHPDGRRLTYGELAPEAPAALERLGAGGGLDPETLVLKDPADFRIIGTERAHLDTPDIVRGRLRFGSDVRLPGMLRAVLARCPVYAGRVLDWDDSACRRVPGFHSTVKVDSVGGDPAAPYTVDAVAVLADSTWAALKAREVLEVRWDEGPNIGESTSELLERSRDLVSRRQETFREEVDPERTFATADRVVEGEYSAPLLSHVPMEPMNCTALWTEEADGAHLEMWAPTQMPLPARSIASQVSGLEPERVELYVVRAGGGFGRRLGHEYVVEAVPIARHVPGTPVQLLYTREDEIRWDHFRPLNVHRLRAGLDAGGRPRAWLHRQAGTSRYAFRQGVPVGLSEFRAGTWPAALVGPHRLEYALAESNLRRGPLRAPGLNTFAWAVECFLDEVADAAGRDPVELRLDLLGEDRDLPFDEDDDFSTGRMAGVLRRAADEAGWGRELPANRGMGIAAAFTFGSYVAHVAEVSVDRERGEIRVHRVVSAIDCGRVVNPNGVRQQMEGGVLDGTGAALYGEITVEGGRVQQSNFNDFRLLRLREAPEVEVHWIESDGHPSGVGEPPYPPMPPALGNAV